MVRNASTDNSNPVDLNPSWSWNISVDSIFSLSVLIIPMKSCYHVDSVLTTPILGGAAPLGLYLDDNGIQLYALLESIANRQLYSKA